MSDPLMNVAVAQSRHDDLMREINSAAWRMRSERAFDRRVRRASRLAALRRRLAQSFRRENRAAQQEPAS